MKSRSTETLSCRIYIIKTVSSLILKKIVESRTLLSLVLLGIFSCGLINFVNLSITFFIEHFITIIFFIKTHF